MNGPRFSDIISPTGQLSRSELERLAQHTERLEQFAIGGPGSYLDTGAGRVVIPAAAAASTPLATPSFSGASASMSANQTVLWSVPTLIRFDTADYDHGNYWGPLIPFSFRIADRSFYHVGAKVTVRFPAINDVWFIRMALVTAGTGDSEILAAQTSHNIASFTVFYSRVMILSASADVRVQNPPGRLSVLVHYYRNNGAVGETITLPNQNADSDLGSRMWIHKIADVPAGGSPGGSSSSSSTVTLTSPPECYARLTLTPGLAVTTADVTAATSVYLTPRDGETIGLYDGVSWVATAFAEISIKLTDTQTGQLATGQTVVTGLTDTSQLVPGMLVSGTGGIATGFTAVPKVGGGSALIESAPTPAVPVGTAILKILSSTSIQLTQAANISGPSALTFTVPASTNVDLFAYRNTSGTTTAPKLEMVFWTNATARATALLLTQGVYTKSGDKTRLYVGSVRTTATAGQTEDSLLRRFVWNMYHREPRALRVTDPTDDWTYGTNAWRAARGSTTNRVEVLIGLDEDPLRCAVRCLVYYGEMINVGVGVGVDSVTVDSSQGRQAVQTNPPKAVWAESAYEGQPGVGYHFLQWLERTEQPGTLFYGDATLPVFFQSGLFVEDWLC